jgi:hypothetical protein
MYHWQSARVWYCSATSAYRQPLPRFPLTRSAKATGRCTTGSQSTSVVLFCHIGLQTTTTEISSHTICQSFWKMYHWQSEHECGTCMLVLRAVRDILSNTCHGRWIGTGGPTAWPPRSTGLNPLVLRVGTPKCGFCWQRRDTSPSHCGCLSDYPQPPRHLWTDMAVHDETCRGVHESHGGHFEHLL